MPRNRPQTEDRIRMAALDLLRRDGFEGWGVNALARAAGVDKVLIYRYFSSLEDVLAEVVRLTPFWPDPDALPDHSPEAFLAATGDALRDQPQAFALLAHPSARAHGSPARRKFADDLARWQQGLLARASGQAQTASLQRLAAQLHFHAATNAGDASPHDLWREVSPPLHWGPAAAEDTGPDSGGLPTELL